MDKKGFLNVLLRFRKIIITATLLTALFSYYNVFLIDHTLENLKFSLEQSAAAYGVDDLIGLDMVLTKALVGEIHPDELNSQNISNLEYASDIIKTGKHFRQLSYMKAVLNTVIEEKEKERGVMLSFLDRINRPLMYAMTRIAHISRSIFAPKKVKPPTPEFDIELIKKFNVLEKEKNLRKLVISYQDFITAYPEYEKISLAKLKLAYTYQRLGEYDVALGLYKEITKVHPAEKEAKIAKIFLSGLEKKDELLKKANILIVESNKLSPGAIKEKQKILYNIGMIYAELLDFDDAAKFFKRAAGFEIESPTGQKAQYNMAWVFKQQNKLEKSLEEFSKIAARKTGDLVYDSTYQLANIHHLQGEYDKFIEISLKLAEDYKHDPTIASLCLFQAGASYMYDLNDTKKAEEIFNRLIKDYSDTSYGKYLAPASPVGLFITYLVPRSTRVVAWRVMGLLCLSGYTGELFKFEALSNEAGFNMGFNNWLKSELPDTVGNLYVDIKGHETDFEKGKATSEARITMGQFNVFAKGEWKLGITEGKTLDLIVTKAFFEKMPIPPVLINNSLTGIKRVIEKNFPIRITNVSMENDMVKIEGIGNRAVLKRIKKDIRILFMADLNIKEIENPGEKKKAHGLFKEKFPEGDFSPVIEHDEESLFLDFFTRISLYTTFKILETIKDSKLDFQRSIRTLGKIMVKEEGFRIDLKEDRINADMARFLRYEFPWVIDDAFLLDVVSLEFDFKNNKDIDFFARLNLGYGALKNLLRPNAIDVEGTMVFEIDEESGIPRWVFKKINVNDNPFPLEKINMLTLRCLNILKDENTPITIEEVRPYDGGIIFKGRGAGDFVARLFADPHPFVIFQIRQFDLPMAGVKRIKRALKKDGEEESIYYRGKMPDDWAPGKLPQGYIENTK